MAICRGQQRWQVLIGLQGAEHHIVQPLLLYQIQQTCFPRAFTNDQKHQVVSVLQSLGRFYHGFQPLLFPDVAGIEQHSLAQVDIEALKQGRRTIDVSKASNL
ncbi:hypothetical protein D9M68_942860 [compost metagenome]